MTEKNTKKRAWVSILGGIVSIATLLCFLFQGYGGMVIAKQDIQKLNDFRVTQEALNTNTIRSFASIDTKLELIMDYFEIAPK